MFSSMMRIVLLSFVVVAGVSPASAKIPESYKYEVGQAACYQIKIHVDDGQTTHVMWGAIEYRVESVRDDTADLRVFGALSDRFETRDGDVVHLAATSPYSGFAAFKVLNPDGHRLRLDRYGRTSFFTSDRPLPYLLGDVAEIVLVPVPEVPQDRWQTEVGGVIHFQQERFGPAYLFQFKPAAASGIDMALRSQSAVERADYSIQDGVVRRDYVLRSSEPVAPRQPKVELTTRSTVTFAEDGFLPSKIDRTGKLVIQQGLDSSTRLISLSAIRISAERAAELAAELEQQKQDAASFEEELQIRRQMRVEDDLDALLSDLQSGESRRIQFAAVRLKFGGHNMDDARIADALADVWNNTDEAKYSPIAEALVKWATPEQSDLVVSLLNSNDSVGRCQAMRYVGERHVVAAIPRLAECLRDPIDRGRAAETLTRFGSLAEGAVARQLVATDFFARLAAVELLRRIGTPRSIPALQKVAKDEPSLGPRVESAIEAMKARREPMQPVT